MQKYRVLQLMIVGAGSIYSPGNELGAQLSSSDDVQSAASGAGLGAQSNGQQSFARSDTQSFIGDGLTQADGSVADDAEINASSNRKAECLAKLKTTNQCMRNIFYPRACSRSLVGYIAILATASVVSFLGKGNFTICEILETSHKNLYHDGICPIRKVAKVTNSTTQTTSVTTQNPFHPVAPTTTTVRIPVGEWSLEGAADRIDGITK